MKEACPICKKDNYIMPGLPSHLKTHSHDELVNYILRKEVEERNWTLLGMKASFEFSSGLFEIFWSSFTLLHYRQAVEYRLQK